MFVKPENWSKLTPAEKFSLRLDHWEKAEGVAFESPEAEAKYRERAKRIRNMYELKGADRIIANPGISEYVLHRGGLEGVDICYGAEKFLKPTMDFHREFEPDMAITPFPYPGTAMDVLQLNTYVWAGQKLPKHLVIQTVEGEYMKPEEYDDFIEDPTAFWMKSYLPRMFKSLEPMAMMPDFVRVSEIVDVANLAIPFGLPPVQEMLKKLMQAGEEALKWGSIVGEVAGSVTQAGYPGMAASFVKAPFDFLGDTLRGTKGIMMDMYRRPKKVLAAVERYVPLIVKQITKSCDMMGAPVAMYPLHKGADGFMSQEQFDTFYWPSLSAVMLGLWEEGIMNYMFAEGGYNTRLETIAKLPKGCAGWWFDQTDMRKAKEHLDGHALIAGNVPASLMSTASVDKMRAYCDDLVELYQDSPGFILANGAGVEMTTDDHVWAFINSVK